MGSPRIAGKITAMFVLALVISLSLSPATSASHAAYPVTITPTKSLDNSQMVYTLTVTNDAGSANDIDNVRLTVPTGLTSILEDSTTENKFPTTSGSSSGFINSGNVLSSDNSYATGTGKDNIVDHIIISEVCVGTDAASNQYVELYNPNNFPENLKNLQASGSGTLQLKMTTGSSDAIQTKPITWTNDTIPAHGFFLIGAGTVSPTPDATYGGNLLAGTDGIQILDGSSVVIDKVAWGTSSAGDIPNATEGTRASASANLAATGDSIERVAQSSSTEIGMKSGGADYTNGNGFDSGNNAADFVKHTGYYQPQNKDNAAEAPAWLTEGDNIWAGGFSSGSDTITSVKLKVEYKVSTAWVDDNFRIRYSLDSGTTWGATTSTVTAPSSTSDTVVQVNVTSDRTWSWTDITNLRIYVVENIKDRSDGKNLSIDAISVEVTSSETPAGWSYSLSSGEITYKTVNPGDRIAAGTSKTFTFKATAPDLENAIRQDYDWYVTTHDPTGSTDSRYAGTTSVVPAVIVGSGHSDAGLDSDNDNKYNYLAVNVKLTVSTGGYYRVSGDLYDNSNDNYVVWADSGWENKPAGTRTIQLRFKSGNIQKLGKTTYYKAKISLYDYGSQLLDNFEYVTSVAYNSDNFEPPSAKFSVSTSHTFSTVDQDVDNLYDYLAINAKINVDAADNYRMFAYLQDNSNGYYVACGESNRVSLSTGLQTVQVRFDGARIRQTRVSDYYKVQMWLYDDNWQWLDSGNCITDNFYYWENFERTAAEIVSMGDNGVDTENDNMFDYLRLNITTSVSKAGAYWINYYLYENSTWNYILDDSVKLNLASGTHTYSINVDGSQIRSAKQSGYYRVRFYINDENWNWIGYFENVTENFYYWENFEPNGAEISSISDWGEDTGGSSGYDYLVVKANLSVYQSGTYYVSGDLSDGSSNHIAWAYSENTLSSNGSVTLRFDGAEIRRSWKNGPYTVNLQLGKAPDTWLDNYTGNTGTAYNWTDFDASSAEIQSMSYDVEDTNANGKYDYLVANLNLNVGKAGTYKANGSLYSYTSSTWITWAENGNVSLGAGAQTIQVRFDGTKIYSAQKSDNYKTYISLYDADYNWLGTSENTSESYSWTDFEPQGVSIDSTSDSWENTDSDSYFNYLVENLNLTINKSGTYHISASLNKNYSWITSAWVDNYYEAGSINVPLRFDGVSIYSSHENGPYTVSVWISDETWNHVTDNQYTTGSDYYAENFQRPPAVIAAAGHTDNGIDTDSDDNYNYLYIGVKVNVTTAGKYRLNGSLLDNNGFWIDWADNEISLSSGDNQTVGLFFTGNRIRTSGKSGPYSVQVYLSKSGTGEYGYGGMGLDGKTLTTSYYSYENFDYPPIEFLAPHSDNVVDTDGDGYYDYLVVSVGVKVSENGTYDLGGSLSTQWLQQENSTPTPSVWVTWSDNQFTLSANENVQYVQLRFSGAQIRRVNENGPYKADVYLSGSSGGRWSWFGSTTYTTNQYYSSQFQRAPIKVRPPYSDYGLDTDGDNKYDFIIMRLKVDVLKAGKYIIGANLWPAGDLQQTVTLAAGDNQTVELRFPASKLNKSKTNGPYSIYFYLMDENRNWLDSGSYQTRTYTYAQFDPPRVELVQPITYGNVKISDAGLDVDSDNLYDFLTVDVSVKVVENGTYRLRGSLASSSGGASGSSAVFDWVENSKYLTVNDNTVRLRFDGYGIASSGVDGRISINLIITDDNGRWLDSGYTYTNASYSSSQFENTRTRSFAIVSGRSVPPSSAGGTVSVSLENTELGSITTVDLKARQDRSSSSVLNVTEQNTAPPGAEDVSGENLGYFDITVSDSSSIQSATIHFKVLKTLVAALGIDIDNIKLMRENSSTGTWTELTTTLDNEDENYYYFSATTPGFSCFVVVGVVQADFSVGLSSSGATVQQGSSTSTTVNISTSTAYSYTVTLSSSGAPAGVSVGFSTSSSTPDFSSTMTITVGSSVSAGSYSITVTGTGADSTTHSTTYSLTVSAAGSVEPPGEEAPPAVVPEETPATFEFSVFRIPDSIKVGETATITFTITNTGDLSGTYTAILTLDGVVVQTKTLTILAGESQEVSFEVVPPADGTYVISIAGQTASLVVTPELTVSQDLIAITAPAVYASEINIDAPAVFDISETSIMQIALSVSASMKNVVMRVRQLLDKPEEVAAPEGDVYKYLEIVAEKVTNDNITSAAITFKVEKSWIENQNIDPDTVALRRYHGGQWQDLITEKIREDDNYIYYVAITPGFSVFAVSGSRAETSTAGPPGITPTMPTTPFAAMPPVLLVAVTAIMLIAVILVVVWRYVSLGTKRLQK